MTIDAVVRAQPGLVPMQMWTWLTERKPHDRQPSTEEELDALMAALCGRTLKHETELWETFQAIRFARNKFAHEGVALDNRTKRALDANEARKLLEKARLIVDWIEEALPVDRRRPQVGAPEARVSRITRLGTV